MAVYQIQKIYDKQTKIRFDYDIHKKHFLYIRAKLYMVNLLATIAKASRDYISKKEEIRFRRILYHRNLPKYCLYVAFLIQAYIRIRKNYQITKMTLYFANDEMVKNIWLIDVCDLEYHKPIKEMVDYLHEVKNYRTTEIFLSKEMKKIHVIDELIEYTSKGI